MATEQVADRLLKRMDVIILLLLESAPDGAGTTTAKIERLLGFSLTQSEVAEIIGKSGSYVSAVMSGKKKSRQKKGSEE